MIPQPPAIALSIAGSDPSGGAGLQADLKSFHTHRVFGMGVVSLLTVQNTLGVRRVERMPPDLISEQIAAVFEDAPPQAIKTGALGGVEQVEAVAAALSRGPAELALPVVVDPVCLSKTRAELLDAAGRAALMRLLLPRATLLTPNLDEARLLLDRALEKPRDIADAARAFIDLGARAVLIKGGHREGEPIDVLCTRDGLLELHGERVATQHTHGVGCSLSAAIAARLALGHALEDACALAKAWVTSGLISAPGIGRGQGAMNHWATLPDGA
ncbi:MAG: hypothetical protein RL701_3500 [Pseudomonadota bacterium]|jgi:hydroxymethylpyrimidine/phosphomethylpyrimidine kinase